LLSAGTRKKVLRQYIAFFVNGVLLGLTAWVLQYYLYNLLGAGSPLIYGLSTALTYVVFVLFNCLIQRNLIFQTNVVFYRFILSQVFIMLLLTSLAPLSMSVINKFMGEPYGDRFGFAVAGVLISIPSFLLSRFWAFPDKPGNK